MLYVPLSRPRRRVPDRHAIDIWVNDSWAIANRANAIPRHEHRSAGQEKKNVSIENEMRLKLMQALEPTRLDLVNESMLHAGHRSSPGTGHSHFRLLVVSPRFEGLGRLARHRMINETLADELAGPVHALAIHAYAPGEKLPE